MNSDKLNIVILGAGNLAWHLSQECLKKNHNVLQIYNRTKKKGEKLSKKLKCEFTSKLENVNHNADVYILCISDKSITEIANSLPIENKLIVHTSGAVHQDLISKNKRGVLYPLQTFSKDRAIDFREIPFCIEANYENDKQTLIKLAKTLSNKVYEMNSDERKILHLAAVFANNFSNFMYSISEDILCKNNISFELLKPLIIETANKIISHSPKEAQTGPAIRNDQTSIEIHLKNLKNRNYYDIYKILSEKLRGENKI